MVSSIPRVRAGRVSTRRGAPVQARVGYPLRVTSSARSHLLSLGAALVFLALVCLGLGCAARERCEVGACPSGTVCELDGTCRALSDADSHRFARALRLSARDWASSTAGARMTDELPADDGERAFFAFELPPGEVVQGTLTVHLAHRTSGDAQVEARVFVASELVSPAADRGPRPRRKGRFLVARRLRVRAGAPIHLDVGPALSRVGEGGGRITLGVELRGETKGWALASPSSVDPGIRPRLDLRLR